MTHSQRLYLLFRAAMLHEASAKARSEGEEFHPHLPYTPLGHAIEGYTQIDGEIATLYLRHPAVIECDERIAGAFRAFFEAEFQREEAQVEDGWKVYRGHGHVGVSPFATEQPPNDTRSSPDHTVRNPR